MYHRAKEPISLIYKELNIRGKKNPKPKRKKTEQKMWTSHKKI